jgi:hypothetical protein
MSVNTKSYWKGYYQKNKEKILAKNRAWSKTSQAKDYQRRTNASFQRKRYLKIKQEIINHYGSRCVCCGENSLIFLALDHVNNDGSEWRRKIWKTSPKSRGGIHTYLWIKKNNYPPIFQLLCHNCNWAKSHGGCPHKK